MLELGLLIGGVRILIRSDVAEMLDGMRERCASYESDGGPAELLITFAARAGFEPDRTPRRAYPGFSCEAESAHVYHLWRRDAQGTISIPENGDEPIVADYQGLPKRGSLEAGMRVAMSLALPRQGGLMLHSSGVCTENGALLFSGPSGAGKTTIARLLTSVGSHVRALADDLAVVRPDEGGTWCAWATPFSGELKPARQSHAPVRALHFLVQAQHHRRQPLEKAPFVSSVLRNMLAYVGEQQAAARALHVATDFAHHVDGFVLRFAKDAKIAQHLGIS